MEKFLETEWSGRVVGGEHAGRQKSGHGEGLWWCVGEVASMGEETAMVVRVFGQVGKHGRAGEQAVRFCGLLGLAGSVGEHHQAEHLRHQDGPQACGGRGCPGWHAPGVDLAGGPGSTFYDPASSAVGGHALRCYNVSARS